MSYFSNASNLLNNSGSSDAGGAPRKPKASFLDFMNQSDTQQDSVDGSNQGSPEKNAEPVESKQEKPSFLVGDSLEKNNEDVAKVEEKPIKVEKRESKPENKRESIKTENKRDSTKVEPAKKDSIKADIKRESLKQSAEDVEKPPKKESLKNDTPIPQKRETIKKELEEKRESIKNPPEEKRESITKPSQAASLVAGNSTISQPGDSDELPHPVVPKSPMHKKGIPLLGHSYTIVEHKVEFPTNRDTPFVPKYYDDSDINKPEKEQSKESWNPTRKKSFQVFFI